MSRTPPSKVPSPSVPPSRLPGLRERKKADLRRRIAEAAVALFRERGYEGTTVDEIVRRADVSQPTFYKYFSNKDAILREHAFTGFATLLEDEAVREGTVEARMRSYLQSIARQMTQDRQLWYVIAVSNVYNPIRDPQLLSSSAAGTRLVEVAIAEGQRRGEFTAAYSPQRLASLLEGVMFRVCVEWGARFPDTRPLGQCIDEGFDLFMRAARPAPGDVAPPAKGARPPRAVGRSARATSRRKR